jgi:hypothetical protein
VLRHFPFVRSVLLTGSAAADDADDEADVDLLVVVAPARLGIAFLLLGTASRLLGRRLFCPNYYLCEGRLHITPSNVYLARELAQAQAIVGGTDTFRTANPWLGDVFPNAADIREGDVVLRPGGRLQRLLEVPFRGVVGDRLERAANRVANARLRAHYREVGRDVPADVTASFEQGVSLRFHARFVPETALERYMARRAEVVHLLEQLDAANHRGPRQRI